MDSYKYALSCSRSNTGVLSVCVEGMILGEEKTKLDGMHLKSGRFEAKPFHNCIFV